jgi:outer membrane protein
MRPHVFTLAISCTLGLFALLACPFAHAQDAQDLIQPVEPRVLTLDDCLAIGMENNISLRQARLGTDISILDRIRAASAFDPGFELDLSTRRSESPDSSSRSSSQLDLAMRYRMPTWTGGGWVFSIDEGRSTGSTNLGETTTGFTSYSSQVGIAYNLPLLEGYGERVNRIGVRRADLGVSRSEAQINEAERGLRLSIIEAYMRAVLADKQIEVAQLSLQTAENLVDEVQARIDVGQLAPYELLAAQAGLAERREALINSETVLATALDSLKELVGLPLTDDVAVDPDILRAIYLEVDPDDLFILAQQNRADLMDLDLRMQQAQLDLFLATDRRQASLNWSTILGLAGQDEKLPQSLGDLSHLSWYTGIEYRLPLGGNRAAEADVSSAQLAIDQLTLQRIDFLRVLQRDIRSAVEVFRNALLRIDVTSQGLEVQEVKMESELARHELGLITSRDLLEFDLDLANARLAYDTALADAITALSRIEYLINRPMIDDAVIIGDIAAEPVASTCESSSMWTTAEADE